MQLAHPRTNPLRTLCGLLAIVISLASGLPAAQASARRSPNVLLLVGDDHSADVLGCYGNSVARTPHLDRLAAEGIRFDRAYTNAPICTPSRQSFLTGRYPHRTGVSLLNQALPETAYTLAHRLRERGYRTAAFGKMHFNSELLHGFEVHDSDNDWRRMDARRQHRPLPDDLEVLPPWRPFHDPARVWLNAFYRPFGRYADEMSATWFVERAVAFMTKHRDEPWFIQIGFNEPHSPFWFPVEYAHTYRPEEVSVPQPGPHDAGQIPRIFTDLTDADKRGIRASYYTSVAWLDHNVGRVLEALTRLNLADETLVIYVGDNGYHLGEHGRFEKHTLYERCVRVPLILRYPGRIVPGRTSRALVELVDLVPTILDYTGEVPETAPAADAPRSLDGYSLRPVIEGARETLRDAVFSEYHHTERVMIRTDRYKLIYGSSRAPVDWYEPVQPPKGRTVWLYELKNDPEEWHNLSQQPDQADEVDQLLDRIAEWYRRFPPLGPPPPPGLDRETFLDWAVAPRPAP